MSFLRSVSLSIPVSLISMVALTLPRIHWGKPSASKTALMVHGLGSSAHTCWQVMEALAEHGWSATAVDLRGHGTAPRASSYRIADFAEDLLSTLPAGSPSWDVVIGHSIGAASAVVASSLHSDWATKLVLIDPALEVDDQAKQIVLANQHLGHLRQTVEDVEKLNPHWHPLDWQLKIQANRQASLFALEHAVFDNDPWDVTNEARSLVVPTLIIGGEQSLGSMFFGDYAKNLLKSNHLLRHEVIEGAGHSVHRDKPAETIDAILRFVD